MFSRTSILLWCSLMFLAWCQPLAFQDSSKIPGTSSGSGVFSRSSLSAPTSDPDFSALTGNLPQLHIEVEEPIERHEKKQAAMTLYRDHDATTKTVMNMKGAISGRGNSTREYMPKKPYKFKLSEKTSLLGLPAKKDWILLANFADKSLIRNYLVNWLAQKIESPFAPSSRFVEVYINEVYQWNYMLTDREVDINKLKDGNEDPRAITSWYVLEIDQRAPAKWSADGTPFFHSEVFPIRVRYPKKPSPKQLSYITNNLKQAEQALFGEHFQDPHEWFRHYRDEESIIKRFLVSELFKNVDSRDFSSIWFFKDESWRFAMGPLRDFDQSAWNADMCEECGDPTWWYVRNHKRFTRMYEDPEFKTLTKTLRDTYKPYIDELPHLIDELALYLESSQQTNYSMWTIAWSAAHRSYGGENSYKAEIEFLKDFLTTRTKWMDENL